ncbi:MAG: hypothetical protein Q8P92_02165 [Candidatus Daviesbacteria bacterium]|nr:hypothetical protein [Candidatus Daviesbacteria bacterium]
MKSYKSLLPIAIFVLLSTILIFSWFRYGYLYGGGDVGIPSYNPARVLEFAKNIWWEASAPGAPVAQGLTSVPMQFFQTTLAKIGLPYFLIQAVLFWIILFSMGMGMYWVGLTVFGSKNLILATLSGLFYMLNPYTMIQVWHRSIYNTFFLAAAFPFLYIFWSYWIKRGKYYLLLLFLLVNILSVYMFGTLGFIFAILFLLLFESLIEIFLPWKGKAHLKTIIFRSILGIISFFIIHIWWLWPVFNITPLTVSQQHTIGENLAVLRGISSQTIIPYSLIGINPFYLYEVADWGEIFDFSFFRFSPYLILIFLIPGIWKSLITQGLTKWALLFFTGMLLLKGAAAPFGNLFYLAFSNLFILGTIRNPFEKLGIFLPFSAAILFALGVDWIIKRIKLKFIVFPVIFITFFIIFGINLWPMWLGKLFDSREQSSFVVVPNDYNQVDDFIKREGKDGKILLLPLNSGESAKYNWLKGYHGLALGQHLFTSLPSISHGFNVAYVDNAIDALSKSFNPDSQTDKKKILAFLQAFNIRYIILQNNLDWRVSKTLEPKKIEQLLSSLDFLVLKGQFGELEIFEVKEDFFSPRIILSSNIQYLNLPSANIWPYLLKEKDGNFITPINKDNEDVNPFQVGEVILVPQNFYIYDLTIPPIERAVGELPAASRILPNNPLYFLISLKELVQLLPLVYQDKFISQINFSGKRLIEAYKLQEKEKSSIVSTINSYNNLIADIFEGDFLKKELNLSINRESLLNDVFNKHISILNYLESQTEGQDQEAVKEAFVKLNSYLISHDLVPKYLTDFKPSLYQISNLYIPQDGGYNLFLTRENTESIYQNQLKEFHFLINGQTYNLTGETQDQFIDFGQLNFKKGQYEIGYEVIDSVNLVGDLEKIKTEGQVSYLNGEWESTSGEHEPSYIEIPINPVSPHTNYQIQFDSWIKLGDKFKIQLIQETDIFDKKINDHKRDFEKVVFRNIYNNYWNENIFIFTLDEKSSKASIRIILEPWDDCRIILVNKKLCDKKDFRFPFEHKSSISLRDIKLVRKLNNRLFIKSTNNELETGSIDSNQVINLMSISPTLFNGKIKITKPTFLIFKESYHPDWKLSIKDGNFNNNHLQRFLANGYSNAWYIDQEGTYEFSLEFTPQKQVLIGILISVGYFIIIIILTFWQIRRRVK